MVQKTPEARRYHPKTQEFAFSVYLILDLISPRAYKFIGSSKKIILPFKITVYKYNKHIRIKPGLNGVVLHAFKTKVKNIRCRKEKIVRIPCDVMFIEFELTYSAKAGVFYGFTEYGESNTIEKNWTTQLVTLKPFASWFQGSIGIFKQAPHVANTSIRLISGSPKC